jgi:glutamine amidotransferase
MPLKAVVADYGVGNLYSIRRSLEMCGVEVKVVTDMRELLDAECIVLPGVGAFDKCMERLKPVREDLVAKMESGTPTLGICIGAQLMFGGSDEGQEPGIGMYPGRVRKLPCRVTPHMGWNTVESDDPLMDGISDRSFYFVHSYYGDASDASVVRGTTEYEGKDFPTFFRRCNTYGTQFHPEKSSASGRKFLENFIRFAEGCL